MNAHALRGFTLIELVAVVIIIGVFAALAVPQVTERMRDRRVLETAERVAHLYRQSRMLALGRGGAVVVQYSNEGNGTLKVLEGRMGGSEGTQGCAFMPNPSCSDVDWSNPATAHDDKTKEARVTTTLAVGLENVYVKMHDMPDVATEPSHYEICYTPLGRTLYRTDAKGAWQPLVGVPTADVYRTSGGVDGDRIGLTRQVLIFPSGGAELGPSRVE